MNTRSGASVGTRRTELERSEVVVRMPHAARAAEGRTDARRGDRAPVEAPLEGSVGSSAGIGGEADRAIVERILARLRHEVGSEPCRRYLDRMAHVGVERDTLSITVPSRFMAGVIDRRLGEPLRRITAEVLGSKSASVSFVIDEAAFEQSRPPERPIREPSGLPARSGFPAERPMRAAWPEQPAPAPRVEPMPEPQRPFAADRLRFENFVVGRSNRMAYGGAIAVAEGDRRLSPLFIHGPCGMGKTHLLHAIAARYAEQNTNARVRCVTAEAFTNQYIAATKAGSLESFRAQYRSVDLLCIDDVSFVANKRATQSELLHTFDAINLDEKLVALASDEHPRDIQHLENGLVSRFLSGAVVRLDAPDSDLRRELASVLASRRGLRFEASAVDAIEQRCQQIEQERSGLGAFGAGVRHGPSVRDLEGLITQIEATVRLLPELAPGQVVGATAVARALSISSGEGGSARVRRPVRMHAIMDRVCTALGVTAEEFVGRGRHQKVVLARALSVLLARQLTNHSYPEIARAMGRPNHSTVITAHKRIVAQIEAGETLMLGPDLVSIDLGELASRLRRDLERADG